MITGGGLFSSEFPALPAHGGGSWADKEMQCDVLLCDAARQAETRACWGDQIIGRCCYGVCMTQRQYGLLTHINNIAACLRGRGQT